MAFLPQEEHSSQSHDTKPCPALELQSLTFALNKHIRFLILFSKGIGCLGCLFFPHFRPHTQAPSTFALVQCCTDSCCFTKEYLATKWRENSFTYCCWLYHALRLKNKKVNKIKRKEKEKHLNGSDSCTSKAAPRILPSFRACASAFSSTNPPRAVLTRKAPCLI